MLGLSGKEESTKNTKQIAMKPKSQGFVQSPGEEVGLLRMIARDCYRNVM